MDLSKARALALRLMDEHKVPPKWKFRFDKSRTRFGQARRVVVRGRVVHEITMSQHLTEISSEESVRDTILHEIAHVLVGVEHMHDAKWRRKARAIGCTFKFDHEEANAVVSLAPYKYYCDEGGEIVFYSHKAVSVTKVRCAQHPGSIIERRHVNGPEVMLSVV